VLTLALKKILGLILAWKSILKVSFLPLGRSCPLQTILLSDLVGHDSPMQIIMAFWRTVIFSRAVTPDPESLNSNKKGAKLPLLSAEGCHTQLDGQPCPLITYHGFFPRAEKPTYDINSRLFSINKKG
jgi:hypothetical protein